MKLIKLLYTHKDGIDFIVDGEVDTDIELDPRGISEPVFIGDNEYYFVNYDMLTYYLETDGRSHGGINPNLIEVVEECIWESSLSKFIEKI